MKVPGLSVQNSEKPPLPNTANKNSPQTAKSPEAIRNFSVLAKIPANTVKAVQPASASFPAGQMTALFKTLGLPSDKLSQSIITFARFFSLPLDSVLLANIRRMSLTAFPNNNTVLQSSREALALAGLSAADKGLELNEKALDEYAAAINPDQHGGQSDNQEEQGQPDSSKETKDQAEESEQVPDKEFSNNPNQQLEEFSDFPAFLKEKFLESAEKSPVLDLLNRLPGKSGRRWMVFPLKFTENGFEYRISLRILLEKELSGKMSLDIVQKNNSGEEKCWFFVFEQGSDSHPRLILFLKPPQTGKSLKVSAKKLSKAMNLPINRVSVRNFCDSDFVSESRNDVLPYFNKEV